MSELGVSAPFCDTTPLALRELARRKYAQYQTKHLA